MIEKLTKICPKCGSIHIVFDEQKSRDIKEHYYFCKKCKRSGNDFPEILIVEIRKFRENLS